MIKTLWTTTAAGAVTQGHEVTPPLLSVLPYRILACIPWLEVVERDLDSTETEKGPIGPDDPHVNFPTCALGQNSFSHPPCPPHVLLT